MLNVLHLLNLYRDTCVSLFADLSLILDQGTLRYSSFYRDVLEIYYNGGWSYICPDSWSDTDSTVACRQLGFTRYHSYDYYFSSTRKNATSFPNNVHVSCIGSESSIIDCSFTNNSCYSYTGSFYYNADYLSLYCTGGKNPIG